MRAALSESVSRGISVIPVLLPGAPDPVALPVFLKAYTCVDMRGGINEPGLYRLRCGIRGVPPRVGRTRQGDAIITGEADLVVVKASHAASQADGGSQFVCESSNPYKGLLAFHEEDADQFFGREEQIGRLWNKFRDLHEPPAFQESPVRLLPVLGPSGSGKSSVARAGLIPELARRPLPGRKDMRVAVLTPGSHPLESLAALLARIATNDRAPVAKTREFRDEMKRRDEKGQFDGLRRIANALSDIASSPLIVLVDQFEEVYSLCKDEEEREAFVENLLDAVTDTAANVSAIITLRTDFLEETQKHARLNAIIASHGLIIPAMNEEELRRANNRFLLWNARAVSTNSDKQGTNDQRILFDKELTYIEVSPNREYFANSLEGSMTVNRVSDGVELWSAKASSDVKNIAFSHDSKFVAAGSSDGNVQVWDTLSGKETAGPFAHEADIRNISFVADNSAIACQTVDAFISLWSLKSNSRKELPPRFQARHVVPAGGDKFVRFSGDGSLLVLTQWGAVSVWDTTAWKKLASHRFGNLMTKTAVSGNGNLVVAENDGNVFLWNQPKSNSIPGKIPFTEKKIAVAVSRDGQMLCTVSWKSINLIKLVTGRNDGLLTQELWSVLLSKLGVDELVNNNLEVSFRPDGKEIAVNIRSRVVFLDVGTGDVVDRQIRLGDEVWGVTYSAKGELISTLQNALLEGESVWRLWNVKDRSANSGKRTLGGLPTVSLSADGTLAIVAHIPKRKMAVMDFNEVVQFYNLRDGMVESLPIPTYSSDGVRIDLSHDNRYLAVGEHRSTIIWTLPPPAGADPVKLRASVEYRTGLTDDENGKLVELTFDERMKRLDSLAPHGPTDVRSWNDALSEN